MTWLDEERLAVIGDIARALFTMAVDLGGKVTGESSYRLSGSQVLGFGVVMATMWQSSAPYICVDVKGA